MSTTKKEISVPEKYAVRAGTKDSGKEYEINNTSLLALKCCFEELEEFWIASNADGFGELVDIIMYKKRKQSGRGVAYLMQLKHQDGAKPLVTDMFLEDKGDFSFKKYSKCYIDMQNKTETENDMLAYLKQHSDMVFIMFTNKRVTNNQQYTDTPATESRKPATVVDFLIKIHGRSPILDDIGSEGDTFKINYEALTAEPNLNKDFLKRLYIVTNQSHNYSIEEKIKKILKDNLGNKLQLSPDDVSDIVSKFGTFVGQWTKGHLGKHYPLTKEQILRKLVELLLFPYILVIDGEDNDDRNEEEDIWYDITKEKDVTIIDDADDIEQRFVTNVTNKIICNSDIVNSITEINKHLMRVGSNSKNLPKSEKYELLWKTNNIPLVLEVADERGVTYIREVLKTFPKVFRIMILNKTKIHFEEFGDINLFVSVSNLSSKHQDYILRKPIKFQGRKESSIHELNINLKSFKVKDILHILCGEYNVGVQFDDVPQFFVEMSLTTHIFDIGLLKDSENVFVVRCSITLLDNFKSVLWNKFGINKRKIMRWERLNPADFNGQIIVFNDLESLQEIETFCLTLTKPVHFLEWHGGDDADLIKSNHINENLKLHKSNSKKSIKELLQNFYENRQTLVISATPGMGKSVLINYFALNMPIDLLVLKIPLAKYQDHYKTCDSQQLNFERFLKEVVNSHQTPNTEIFNSVFNQFLNCKKVVFLLDGLDEVPVHRQNGAIQLIKFVNQLGHYTCVTTRPLLQEKLLESTLNTFAITLNMFTKEEQTSFLRNYFANFGNVMPSNEKVEEFVYELLKATKLNLNDFDDQFTGVPLQTTLLAEVFENDFLKYLDDGIFKNQRFDLIYLYEHFIKKKIEIAFAKVENISEDMIYQYQQRHSLYALRHLFDEQDLVELEINDQINVINDVMQGGLQSIQKDGITVIDGDSNVTFVHQTYAEYLAASWLSENINTTHKEIVRKLVIKCFDSNFVVVRIMFDRILAKNRPLHTAIINRQFDTVQTLMLDENSFDVTDRGGRTILHLLSAWGFLYCYHDNKDFLRKEVLTALDTIPKNKLKNVEDELHYTPLDYAILSHSLDIADMLALEIQNPICNVNINIAETPYTLSYVAQFHSVSLYVIILKCILRTSASELEIDDIHKSIRNGYFDRIRSLISKKNLDNPDSNGCTLLHTATKCGQKNTVEFLLKRKVNVNGADNKGRSALHWASYLGDMEIISLLLDHGAKPDATDCYNLTTYHYAILSSLENQADIVSLLLTSNRTTTKFNTIDIEYLNYQCKVHPIYLTDLVNQREVLNLMLSHADVNMKNWKGMTALMVAAEYDDVDSLKLLLARKADIEAKNDSYETALHYAAKKGHAKVVTALLTNNADPNARYSGNKSPLHWAALKGFKDVVTILLTHNADVEARDSVHRTPLHWATLEGHKDVVAILLAHNANVEARDADNMTPLHWAAARGRKDLVTIFLTHNVDVEARDSDYNMTPLHWAILYGYKNVVTILLAHNADVEARDSDDKTPLHHAALRGHQDIVNMLLTHNADVEAIDFCSKTPLHFAASGNHQDVVTILLDVNANVEPRDYENSTPLHLAAFQGYKDVVTILLAHNADVEARDSVHRTPLQWATLEGHTDVVAILLTHNVDVEARDSDDNMTPLHWAAFYGYKDVVTILLAHNADVEAIDMCNRTSLHYAASRNHQDVVTILLAHNANVEARDSDNKTPLHYASSRGHQHMVTLLTNAQSNN